MMFQLSLRLQLIRIIQNTRVHGVERMRGVQLYGPTRVYSVRCRIGIMVQN